MNLHTPETAPNDAAALLSDEALSPSAPAKKPWQKFWKGRLADARYRYGYLLFAALIPAVLMYLMYLARGLYPFGEGSVLVLDLSGQYIGFYEALHDILHGEIDLLYSFSRALGGEFLGIYDYYIASPFAMLLYFFPERLMLEGLLFVFLLKTALCGLNMGIYLHKHAKGEPNRLLIVTFSIMYALSAYCIIQQHNSMWIDAVLWLPLLALGIEELIKRGKFRLYVFSLAITLFSNFYIGYMVVIFTVAYCFYYYFAHNRNNENNPLGESNHFAKSVGRVAVWSVLAVGIAAVVILSARYSLSFGKDEFSNPSWEITQKFDFLEFFYKFLPSSYDTVRPAGLPFVYCGMLAVITVPVFFLSKKIGNREKVAAAAFILFFVASFATSTLDLIWHGFQKPNWLNHRYSFMLCFFLLVLGYRGFEQIRYTSRKALLGVAAAVGMFILVIQKLSDFLVEENEKLVVRPFATIWLSLGCLIVYFTLICLWGKVKALQRENIATILLFVVCTEMFLSGLTDMNSFDKDVTYTKYTKYHDITNTLRPITDVIYEYDDGFYRMEKTYFRKTNDNYALQIRGLSCSTSTINRETIDFLRDMGYASKSNWSKYMGGTPVNDSLLGLKYLITNNDLSDYYGEPLFTPNDYEYPKDYKPNGNYSVYRNEYALSFAYGVADSWLEFDSEAYDTPFDYLNAMITAMLGEEETVAVFVPATQNGDPKAENFKVGSAEGHESYKLEDESKKESLTYSYTVPADTEIFLYFPTNYVRAVNLTVNGSGKGTFGGNETHRIVSLGKSDTGAMTLKLSIDKKNNTNKNFYVKPRDSYLYYIDWAVFEDAMERLSTTQYEIDKTSTDSHLTGTVTTAADQLMFTSIPYDEGWNIYVDGQKVDLLKTADALIAFRVDGAGEHTIEMRYLPSVVVLGFSISVVCLLIFVAILIIYPFIKKVPYLRRLVMIEGEELPEILTPEMLADIEPGDIGAPSPDIPPVDDTVAPAGKKSKAVDQKSQTGNKKKSGK